MYVFWWVDVFVVSTCRPTFTCTYLPANVKVYRSLTYQYLLGTAIAVFSTPGTSQESVITAFRTVGTREDSRMSVLSTLGNHEESVLSAFCKRETRKGPINFTCGALGIRCFKLARTRESMTESPYMRLKIC